MCTSPLARHEEADSGDGDLGEGGGDRQSREGAPGVRPRCVRLLLWSLTYLKRPEKKVFKDSFPL